MDANFTTTVLLLGLVLVVVVNPVLAAILDYWKKRDTTVVLNLETQLELAKQDGVDCKEQGKIKDALIAALKDMLARHGGIFIESSEVKVGRDIVGDSKQEGSK